MARIKADVLDSPETEDFTITENEVSVNEASTSIQEETPATEERFGAVLEPQATTEQASVEPQAEQASTEPQAEKAPVDFEPFKAAVEAAVSSMDAQSGQPNTDAVTKVQEAYRDLEGNKAKADARKIVEGMIHAAVKADNLMGAKAIMFVADEMRAGSKVGKKLEPKVAADPTQAYVEKRVTLDLARSLTPVPEGVAEDVEAQITARYQELYNAASEYIAYLAKPKDQRGDEPDLNPIAKAAAKLAIGGKARTSSTSSGTRSSSSAPRAAYDGPKRSIKAHIAEAFAGVESGRFLKISEIVKFQSKEYGNTPPSAGAISASLKSGKFPEGVESATVDGNFGARKK